MNDIRDEQREFTRGLEGVVAAESSISYVDGVHGRLLYQGYDIHDLAEHTSFEETVFLLWRGWLPTRPELEAFQSELVAEMRLPSQVTEMLKLTPPSSHPMAVLRTAVSMLANFDPDAEHNSTRGQLAQGQAAGRPGADHHRRPAPHPLGAAGAFARPELRRFLQLPVHDAGHAAQQAGAQRDGSADGAARRPRAERQHLRRPRHRQHPGRHARRAGRRARRAQGPAPRRREPTCDGDDPGHPRCEHGAGLHRRHVGEQEAHHGLRPPRLPHRGPARPAPAQIRRAAVRGAQPAAPLRDLAAGRADRAGSRRGSIRTWTSTRRRCSTP